jgi:hypothetical protein
MQWSHRRWRRYAAQLGTAMLISFPLFAGAAAAGPADPQVEFSGGGLGMLLCGSKPDVSSISVFTQAKVIFVNGLGQGATLQIDGENAGAVNDGEAVEVQFHHGPVAVAMVPECLLNLNGNFSPVTVQVASSNSSPRTSPRAVAPKPRPSTSTGTATNSPTPARPQPTVTPTVTSSPVPPLDEQILPLDPDAVLPSGTASSSATVVSGLDGTQLQAASRRDRGPIGLLAIVATVCVVGVSAGAIRAIITQRANRAEFA